MTSLSIKPITDPGNVCQIIMQQSANIHIANTLLSLFDNLRPDYSPIPHLELGGIALSEEDIRSMIQLQAQALAQCARGYARLILLWKAESARLYAAKLKRALEECSDTIVLLSPIQTKWITNHKAIVLTGDLPPIAKSDYVVCADFMCGSGGTMVAVDEWLISRGVVPSQHVVLVDVVGYERQSKVPAFLDPRFIWTEQHWLIGFNSDCPIAGRCEGRDIPFLAFLKPAGEGIRCALAKAMGRSVV